MNDAVSRQFVSIMLRYNFLLYLLLLYSCILLKMAGSNVSNSNEIFSNSSSREQMRPMPLILHLNKSTADLFIQEANRMFVSNTSFDDLLSDNDTHQMFLRNRDRKRQVRLKTIQQEILHRLGFEQEPNITSTMSEQQRKELVSSYDMLQEISEMNETTIEV